MTGLAPLFAALATFFMGGNPSLHERGAMVLFPPYRGPAIAAVPWGPLAACESGVQWSIDSRNGFYGGLQISEAFWLQFRPKGAPLFPDEATPFEQVQTARRIVRAYGFWMWSVCGERLATAGTLGP